MLDMGRYPDCMSDRERPTGSRVAMSASGLGDGETGHSAPPPFLPFKLG